MNGHVSAYMLTSATSTLVGIYASLQLLLDPSSAWVPVGVLFTLLTLAVVTTAKVVRLIDRVQHDIETGRREREMLAQVLSIKLKNSDGRSQE